MNSVLYIFPGNFQKALMYYYNYATSSASFIGYLIAAIYYVLTYFGFGAQFC